MPTELDPDFVLDPSRFQDTWDDAHMDEVLDYLAHDGKLMLPLCWHGPALTAISSLPKYSHPRSAPSCKV